MSIYKPSTDKEHLRLESKYEKERIPVDEMIDMWGNVKPGFTYENDPRFIDVGTGLSSWLKNQ